MKKFIVWVLHHNAIPKILFFLTFLNNVKDAYDHSVEQAGFDPLQKTKTYQDMSNDELLNELRNRN